MKNKLIKIIALVLSVTVLFAFTANSLHAAEYDMKGSKNINGVDVKILKNDEYKCQIMTMEKNEKIIATLDKITNEIDLTTEKAPKFGAFGFKFGKSKVKNFDVNVKEFDGKKIKAEITDVETKKTYTIDENSNNKVKAQAVLLPALLGLTLIEILMSVAATVVISGIVYYTAKDVVERIKNQKKYDYFMAIIKNNNVYIGNALSKDKAIALTSAGGDTFAVSKSKAKTLAQIVGGTAKGPENHGNKSGYYDHYHPKYGSGFLAHCFYK